MQISAEHYFHAALERIQQASSIYRAGNLNEEHLQSKGLSPDTVLQQVARFQGLMNHVVLLWTNDLRYAPEALARSRVVKMRLYERRKGNILKDASLRLQNASQEIITRGAFLWTWSKE